MKDCKSAESFCISIIFTQMICSLKLWYIYCCHVYFFCFARFLNMCKPRTIIYLFCRACLPGLAFYGSVVKYLLSRIGMVNAGWLTSIYQKFSCEWNLSFFKAVPPVMLPFYLGSPLHLISSLFSHFCLYQNSIPHKMLKLGFEILSPFFSECTFQLLATSLPLVLVIYLSWYFYLKLSVKFISFNIWR